MTATSTLKTVVAYRNGEAKLRIPAEVRNGVLRNGNNILINADLIKPPHSRASVSAAIKTGEITPEIEAMGMHIGDNGNGLICRWEADINAERAEKQRQHLAAHPELAERNAIAKLFAAAERS